MKVWKAIAREGRTSLPRSGAGFMAALVACLWFLAAPASAQAQYGSSSYRTSRLGGGELGPRAARNAMSRFTRPTVSPYLNLNRGLGRSIVEYYSTVRPTLEFDNPVIQDRVRLERDRPRRAEGGQDEEESPIRTGRRGFFMNYSHYYR